MEDTGAGLSYPDVLDHWDRSRAFGDPRDFSTFAKDMETLHPGVGFGQAASRDGWWTRLSTRLDQNVFHPVAEKTTAPLGEAVGGLFGDQGAKVGREVGLGLPRTVTQLAPLLIPGVGEIYGGALAGGILGTEFGAQTYAETGSPKAALISGATAGILPAVSRIGGAVAPRLLGLGEAVPGVGVLPKEGVSQAAFKAAQFGGSQAAMIGLNEASMYAEDKTLGQPFDPLDPHFLATQIPWTVYDAVKIPKGVLPTAEAARAALPKPQPKAQQDYVPPKVTQPEAEATIEATLRMLNTAYTDPNATPEAKEAALAAAAALVQNPKGVTEAAKVTKPATEAPTEISGYGREFLNGNWKVLTTDAEGNEKTVWVNGVKPVKNEDGTVTFQALPSQVSENVASPLTKTDFVRSDPNQPELPPQKNPMGLFPWEQPDRLAPDETRTLQENGVKVPHLRPAVKKPSGEVVIGEPGTSHFDVLGEEMMSQEHIDQTRATHDFGFVGPDNQYMTREQAHDYAVTHGAGHLLSTAPDALDALTDFPEVNQALKPIAQALESASTTLSTAQAKIAKVPESAEEIPGLVGQGVETYYHGTRSGELRGPLQSKEPGAETQFDRGVISLAKDPKAAATYGRLYKVSVDTNKLNIFDPHNPEHVAQLKALVKSPADVREFYEINDNLPETLDAYWKDFPNSGAGYEQMESARELVKRLGFDGYRTNELGGELHLFDPKHVLETRPEPEQVIKKAIESGATPTQAVEKARLATQTPQVDAAMQLLRTLQEEAKTVSLTGTGKPQAIYDDYIRDDNGENFATQPYAEAFKEAHPEYENYAVRNAGKGKGFYLARQINKEVSLEGTNLEKVIPSTTDVSPLESRPDVSFEAALQQIQRASQSPVVFAREAGFDDVSDAILALRQAKVVMPLLREGQTFEKIQAALAEAKVAGFTSPRNAVAVMDAVRDGLAAFAGKYRNFTLDSVRPFDQKTVDEIGIQNPDHPTALRNALQWFVNHKDSGIMGELVGAMLKAHGTDGISLSFDPHDGMVYYEGERRINLAHLPAEGEGFDWVSKYVVHEYAHDVGEAILARTDPAAVQLKATLTEGLNALRNSPELPKKVRDSLGKAQKFYEEFTKTNQPVTFLYRWLKEVGTENYDWFKTVYGLSNEKELFSTMFESPKMVELMTKTKMTAKPVTVLQYLSQVWNKIFGGRKEADNVFGQILSGLDNYLAGVRIRPTQEGIVRSPQAVYNGRDYIRDSLVASGVRPEALASRLSTVENVFNTGSLQHSIDGFTREMGAGTLPATANAGPLRPELTTALTSAEPKDVRKAGLNLLASEVPVHQDLLHRMKEDVETAINLYNNIKKGLIPGELPPNARENLQQAHVRLDALGQALDKQARDISRFNDLDNFTQTGRENTLTARLTSDRLPAPPDPTELQPEALAALGLAQARTEKSREALERGKGASAGWAIAKWGMFTTSLKKLIPAIAPPLDKVNQVTAQTNVAKTELDAVYQIDPTTKELDPVRREANRRVATNETLMRAASDIKLALQELEAKRLTQDAFDDFKKNVLSRFNPKDRADIELESNNARAVHDHWTEVVAPRFFAQKNMLTVAKVIALREQGMVPDQARELAGQFASAIDQLKNPQSAQVGVEMLNALRPKMQPETYLAAFQLAKGLADDTTEHLDFIRSRPNYVTEQRIDGKHGLRMITPDSKPFYNTYSTRDAADAKKNELEKKGYKFVEYVSPQDANVPYRGVTDEFIGKLRELDVQRQTREAAALQNLTPEQQTVVAQLLPAFNRANDYEESLASFSPIPGAGYPHRHFVAGREELNMVQQQNMFYGRATNWIRHQLLRGETELDLLHPDLLSNREATKLVRDHVSNVLTPDSSFVRKWNEFTYNWKLAWNFGVNALHLIQPLNTGMASLIAETGGVGDALNLTIGAQKALIQRGLKGDWQDPAHAWLMRTAKARGWVGILPWEGYVGDSDRNAIQYGSTPVWRQPAAYLAHAARTWNGAFFKLNDMIGLLAGFDHFRSQGMSFEDAANRANDVKNQGYFTGGKTQRAINQWAMFGPQAKAVPQLMSSLQTYVQGWFSLLASNYKIGFGGAPEGMSASQVLGAKKAFLYQLGAQAVLAGALGLPGVGQGMALVKQTIGVDVMSWLRQHLGELFDEDQQAGGLMTTLAMHGATAAFSPVDISGRHMPSVPYIGVTPYKGFDIANLAGAPVSAVADLVKGIMAAAKGDTIGMSSLLPEVLKGPLRLWQGEGDVRDPKGNLITKLSPSEQFVTALGMKPSRVTALQDVATAVKEANVRARAEKSDVTDRLATVYRKNGVEQGHAALVEYMQQHPDEDGKALVREVSRKVLEQTTVPDWSQRANVGADLAGLGGEQTSQASRLQQLQGIQSSLGLRQRPNPRQQLLMDEIDQLRQTDPYLSVEEAAQSVRSQQRPRRSNAVWNPEYQ